MGHVVSEEGLSPDPDKVLAISALTLPTTSKDMAAAIGLMGYYRKFVLNYSKVEAPLREMRRAPERWKGKVAYSDEERAAFESLRDALTKAPILAHPNWSVPFEVHTDASHKGLGAVLCQKVNGKEIAIAYASRAVSKTEAPWSTWELEALAMIWAVRHFKMYLYNTHFIIRTDSEAARRLVAADDKDAGGRLLRWRLALQEFDYTVIHRSGAKNANADALSRMFLESDDPFDEGPTSIDPLPALNLLMARDGGSAIVNGWGEGEWNTYEELQNSGTAWWRQHDSTWQEPDRLFCSLEESAGDDVEPRERPAHYEGGDSEAWTRKEWIALQVEDERCDRTRRYVEAGSGGAKHFELLEDGMLCKKAAGTYDRRIVVPETLKAFIMKRYHSLPITGHKGRKRTIAMISRRYYWRHMHRDIGPRVG